MNRLPTEILAEIFAFLHPRIHHRYLPLIHATHVCRHWRDIISSTPTSWTWINPKWSELLPLLLRLSEPAPIEVEISNLEDFNPSFVDLLLPRSAKIAAFVLGFSAATRGYCSQIISRLQCMPNLRLLSILAEPGLTPHPLPILSGGMPRLESLTLSFFSYEQQVTQLTHLTTINITVDYSALTNVIGLFANNPKLRSAILCGSFRDKSCQRRHGAVRMDSLLQLDLLSWGTIPLLPFLTLGKGAHIRALGPASIAETVGTRDFLPSDTAFLPNLVGLKQLRWYIMARDTFLEFTGPNGGFSILLCWHDLHSTIGSFPLGEIEEFYCESSNSTLGPMTTTKELNQIITTMVPAVSQLREITFAMCANFLIQAILPNLNRAVLLKRITLSHCDHPDPSHDIFHALLLFAKRRVSINAKLEEVRVVCRPYAQRPEFLDRRLSKAVGSFALVYQPPSETRQTNIEIERRFPASIQKTYPLYT